MKAPATKSDKLNALYKECGLVKEDVFTHQHYTILTRSGIEKVQAFYKIEVKYKALRLELKYAVIKAIAAMGEVEVETYGSAVPDNCKNSYFAETAEKRALSRAVLKLTGLYQHGVFGEDESEDFKPKRPQPEAVPPVSATPTPSVAAGDVVSKKEVLELLAGADSLGALGAIWIREAKPWQLDTEVFEAKEKRKADLQLVG